MRQLACGRERVFAVGGRPATIGCRPVARQHAAAFTKRGDDKATKPLAQQRSDPARLSSSRSTIYACNRVSTTQPGDITQIWFVLGFVGVCLGGNANLRLSPLASLSRGCTPSRFRIGSGCAGEGRR
jgi:hypothetical protein